MNTNIWRDFQICIRVPLTQKQPLDVFCKNFVKFTKKHLCHSLLLNKVAGLRVINTKLMILQNLFY